MALALNNLNKETRTLKSFKLSLKENELFFMKELFCVYFIMIKSA